MALLPFRSPTTIGIFGATQAGKSTFIRKLLNESANMFTIPPKWILYCYGVEPSNADELVDSIEGLTLNEGIPSEELINEKTANREHGVIVLDDLISAVMKSNKAESLFIMGSHHKRLTVILVSQNMFYQAKAARTISLNMHYMVLYRNLRDKSQIKCLAQQIFPGQVSEFMAVYNDIHKDPFNYLVIDLHPHADGEYRLRTHIFTDETPIIYKLE
jgi:hypothetical protein